MATQETPTDSWVTRWARENDYPIGRLVLGSEGMEFVPDDENADTVRGDGLKYADVSALLTPALLQDSRGALRVRLMQWSDHDGTAVSESADLARVILDQERRIKELEAWRDGDD